MQEKDYIETFNRQFVEESELKKINVGADYYREMGTLGKIRGIPEISEENIDKVLRVITDAFKNVQAVEYVEPDFCGDAFEKWARNHTKALLLIAWNLIQRQKVSVDALTAERTRAEKAEKQRDEILRLGSPYPLTSILEILPIAMNHLLSNHDCDHHGYETWMAASQAAVDLRSNLEQLMEDNK